MANCDKNILDLDVSLSRPNPTDYVIMTQPDGFSIIRQWASLFPPDIEFKVDAVGNPANYPASGQPTFQDDTMIGRRIRLYRQQQKQSLFDAGGGYFYAFNKTTGTLTVTPNFIADEIIQIEVD
jgi:hypothetical protein